MKKRTLPILLAVVICLCALHPYFVSATTPLDPDAEASLTLHYQKDAAAFPGLQIGIYRVAQAFSDGTFGLIEPFASYPINIHDITRQEQWHIAAQTLWSAIVAEQVLPNWEKTTDMNGTVVFTGLKTGLYFVQEVIADNAEGTYVFNQFLIYLPTPQSDGTFHYDVQATPKCTGFVPKTRYSVNKLWQDAGMQHERPDEIIVDIYKDGTLHESQTLSASNNWSYTWSVPADDQSKWTVAERDVPSPYTVSIQQSGSVFTIINARPSDPILPPQTGDSFHPLPWIISMCLSGIVLILLGIYNRRRV